MNKLAITGVLTIIVIVSIIYVDLKHPIKPLNIFILFYLFYYTFGTFHIYFNYPSVLSPYAFMIINFSYFFCILGIKVFEKNKVFVGNASPYSNESVVNLRLYLKTSMLLSIMISVAWWVRIGVIPIFYHDIEYARVDLAHGTFFHRQLMSLFLPFYLFYLHAFTNKYKTLKDTSIILCFILGSFILISQGYRTFMLSFWVISTLVINDNIKLKVTSGKFLSATLFSFVFIFAFGLYRFFSADQNIDDSRTTLEVLFHTFYVRPMAVDDILDAFPRFFEYQYLYTYLRGLNFLIPIYESGLGIWLKEDVLLQEFAGAGYNPGIIGELILSFGDKIIFLTMFIYGVLISIIDRFTFSRNVSSNVIIKSTIIFYFILSISPGLSTSLFSIIWAISQIVFAFIIIKLKIISK